MQCSSTQTAESGEANPDSEEANSREIVEEGPADSAAGNSGCVSGDCENGEGRYVWPDGSAYSGQWQEGQRNGLGTYIWASGDKYIGQFKSGDCNGTGIYEWANGARYDGEWQAGKRHGTGSYTMPDGQKKDGNFENDAFVGTAKSVG